MASLESLSSSEASFVLEDLRIATLQRKLARSSSLAPKLALALAEQIGLALESPENRTYVVRASSIIVDVGLDMLVVGRHDERVRRETSAAMATVAAIMGEEDGDKGLGAFIEHLLHFYDKAKEDGPKATLLRTLDLALANANVLGRNNAEKLVVRLQQMLEVEQAEVMIEAAHCLDKVANNKPTVFETSFQELVDILVGWYIDEDDDGGGAMSLERRRSSIASLLQSWHTFWITDLTFSAGLMQQFVEDFQTELEEWKQAANKVNQDDDKENDENYDDFEILCGRMESFLKIFHVTLNCLRSQKKSKTTVSMLPGQCSEWCVLILKGITELLESIDGGQLDLVGVTADIGLDMAKEISGLIQDKMRVFTEFERAFLHGFDSMSFVNQRKCLNFITQLLMTTTTNNGSVEETMTGLLDPLMPHLDTLDSSVIRSLAQGDVECRHGFVKLLQSLLSSKNVRLLQLVYNKLVKLFDKALRHNASEDELVLKNYCLEERQVLLLVLLQCLTELATQRDSMLGLWALKPSIFDVCHDKIVLIIDDTRNHGRRFKLTAILEALIQLIKAHCESHKNFVLSSSLLLEEGHSPTQQTSFSSTAFNMERILRLFVKLVAFHKENNSRNSSLQLKQDVFRLVLEWIGSVLNELINSQAPANVYDSEPFKNLVCCIIDCGQRDQTETTIPTLSLILTNLSMLLRCPTLETSRLEETENGEVITIQQILDVAHFHLSSNDRSIRSKCLEIVETIDPFIRPISLTDSLTTVMMKKCFGQYCRQEMMRNGDCQVVIRRLLMIEDGKDECLNEEDQNKEMSLLSDKQVRLHVNAMLSLKRDLQSLIPSNSTLFTSWISFELASFCVNSKLKTPLGKAKDTLLAIEKCLRDLHQSLKEANIDQSHCRQLLLFFRDLERCINNACDNGNFGNTDTNDYSNNRNVTAFFVANRGICVDWLSRLRPVVVSLAYFALRDLSVVVEQCERGLKELELNEDRKDDKKIFISFLAAALFELDDKAGLEGLQEWLLQNRDDDTHKENFVLLALRKEKLGLKENALKILLDNADIKSWDLRRLQEGVSFELLTNCRQNDELNTFNEFLNVYKNNGSVSKVEFLKRHQASFKSLTTWNEKDEAIAEDDKNESLDLKANLSLLRVVGDLDRGIKVNDRIFENIKTQLEESLRNEIYNTNESTSTLKFLLLVTEELRATTTGVKPNLSSLSTLSLNCSQLLLVRQWRNVLARRGRNLTLSVRNEGLSSLDLDIVDASMKEGDFKLAAECLYEALFKSSSSSMDVSSLAVTLDRIDFKKALLTPERAKAFSLSAKLLSMQHVETSVKIDIGIVERIGQLCNDSSDDKELKRSMLELASEALSDIAVWVQNESNASDSNLRSMLSPVLELENSLSSASLRQSDDVDVVVGRLLNLALIQSPHLFTIWNDFAHWALNTGEELLAKNNERLTLTQEDRLKLEQILLSNDIAQEHVDALVHVLIDNRQSEEELHTKLDQCLKRLHNVQQTCEESSVSSQLLEYRSEIRSRLFFYHTSAIKAFFRFIDDSDASQRTKLISATLKVLRITVKYARELSECLQEGLSKTRSEKWRPIVPQLFSRLNHPVFSVRKRISELLCRMANDYPDLIIFPAIVGHLDSKTEDKQDCVNDHIEDESELGQDPSKLLNDLVTDASLSLNESNVSPISANAYERITFALEQRLPKSVAAVELLVRELRRVHSLPDELWLTTLQQSSSDINRRLRKMDEEVTRLQTNRDLSTEERQRLTEEKYNILFRPLLYILEQLEANTCVTDESKTNHELQFIKKYGAFIETAMNKVRRPSDFARPKEGWIMLVNQLQVSLSQKLTSKTNLSLKDISPRLSTLNNTAIPMPGTISSSSLVSISRMEDGITTLLTKTKPKKMVMVGSDGKRYTFLFKGLEDLHLDERIMQFLAVSNCLMTSKKQDLKARHYSVTPLGRRSGLIQWVSGAVPLYSLFKQWQSRQLAICKADQKPPGVVALKPADFFYSKLMPVLKKEGLDSTRRSLWPVNLMTDVLKELQKETPNDIFARELMRKSLDSRHWLEIRRRLTKSIAVMSILGYVLGLGDRHLENLLIDFEQGEIVHIDYNVCFEKGLQLRIPERVPCRLTSNIRSIFGLTGVQGQFTEACHDTMRVLRDGRDTLLTLLEAFVYDPLVDWTPQMATLIPGVTKSLMSTGQMQTQVSLSMLSVRVAEMKTQWLANRDDLVSCLRTLLEDNFDKFIEAVGQLEALHQNLVLRHEDMALIKQCQAQSKDALLKHPLFQNTCNVFRNRMRAELELSNQRTVLREMVEGSEKVSHQLQRALTLILSHAQLNKWFRETSSRDREDDNSVVTSFLVQAFLEQAGQQLLSSQLEEAERTLRNVLIKQRRSMSNLIQLLSHLGTIVGLLPQSYREDNFNVVVADLGSSMVEEMSLSKCETVLMRLEKKEKRRNEKVMLVMKMNLEMHFWNHELQRRLNDVLSRLNELGDPKTSLKTSIVDLKPHLNDGKSKKFVQDNFDIELMNICLTLMKLEAKTEEAKEELADIVSERGHCFLIDEIVAESRVAISIIEDCHNDLGLISFEQERKISERNLLKEKAVAMKGMLDQLSHLKQSFFGVVLPEALKAFQRGDLSAYKMAEKLATVIDVAGIGLDEMLQIIDEEIRTKEQESQLEESGNEASINVAKTVCSSYSSLLKNVSDSHQKDTSNLNSGQMLLLAFDSLFTHLNNALNTFNEKTSVNDPKLKGETLEELRSLRFNVHRLQLMQRFFVHCQKFASLLDIDNYEDLTCLNFSENVLLLPTLDEVARDIKVFVAETVRHRIVGRFSRALKRFFVDDKIAEGHSDETISGLCSRQKQECWQGSPINPELKQFLSLEISHLISLIRLKEEHSYMEQMAQVVRQGLDIERWQHKSFNWLHFEVIERNDNVAIDHLRGNFLNELRSHLDRDLISKDAMEVDEALKRYDELHASVEQRLKWASGANTELQDLRNAYLASYVSDVESAGSMQSMRRALNAVTEALLQHEETRGRNREFLDHFRLIVEKCRDTCKTLDTEKDESKFVGYRLFKLNKPPQLLSKENCDMWLEQTEKLVGSSIKETLMKAEEKKNVIKCVKHKFALDGEKLKTIVVRHQKLVADVGAILKTIAKSDEFRIPAVEEYLVDYSSFSESASKLISGMLSKDEWSEERVRDLATVAEQVKDVWVEKIYEPIIFFGEMAKDERLMDTYRVDKEEEEEKSVSNEQEKNDFALTVLKRVRNKLEGNDHHYQLKNNASVQQQVELVIRESMREESLALMYEGWTSWI